MITAMWATREFPPQSTPNIAFPTDKWRSIPCETLSGSFWLVPRGNGYFYGFEERRTGIDALANHIFQLQPFIGLGSILRLAGINCYGSRCLTKGGNTMHVRDNVYISSLPTVTLAVA